jgi:hypothetical protein
LLVLAMKVVLAPVLVIGATVAGRRWGAIVGGVVTAVPIVAGPILAILTIDHGRAFGAGAARGALLGVVALSAFCAVFAWSAAGGRTWPRALALGWLAYAVVGAVVSRFDVQPGWGLLVGLAALGVGYRLIGEPGQVLAPDRPPPTWDLPARAGLTAVLVLALTAAAGALGPAVSGVLTPFPVATTVLAAFTLQQDGPVAARALLRGFVRALPGFALCFFVVAVALS